MHVGGQAPHTYRRGFHLRGATKMLLKSFRRFQMCMVALTCDRMIIRANGITGSHSSIETINKRPIPALARWCAI